MTRPDRPTIPNADRINAHLAHEAEWASLSVEEQARVERRRAVFGSAEVAHEMNRRGL